MSAFNVRLEHAKVNTQRSNPSPESKLHCCDNPKTGPQLFVKPSGEDSYRARVNAGSQVKFSTRTVKHFTYSISNDLTVPPKTTFTTTENGMRTPWLSSWIHETNNSSTAETANKPATRFETLFIYLATTSAGKLIGAEVSITEGKTPFSTFLRPPTSSVRVSLQ